MKKSEYREIFAKALTGLAETYGIEIKDSRIEIYWGIFQSRSPAATLGAINMAATACKFFPSPAELIDLMAGAQPDPGAKAEVAWAGCLALLDQCEAMYGHYATLDGAAAWAINNLDGGYVALTRCPEKDLPYKAKRFKALYLDAVERGLDQQAGKVYGAKTEYYGRSNEYAPLALRYVPETLLPQADALMDEINPPANAFLSDATARLAAQMRLQ